MIKTKLLALEILETNNNLRSELYNQITDNALITELCIFEDFNVNKINFIKNYDYNLGDSQNLYNVLSIRKQVLSECFSWLYEGKYETVINISNNLAGDMQLDLLQNEQYGSF